MANEHEPEFGQMWRQQPRHEPAMPVEEVRRRATEFDAKVERWKLVGAVTVTLLIVKNIWEVWVDTDMVERAGDALMVLALVFIVYRFWRHSRLERVPSTLGRMSCIEYYRARLLRERELSHDAWAYVLPFVPGFGVIILARAFQGRPSSQVAALMVLAIIMFAMVLWVIARGRRTIEREIAALAGE